MTAIWFLHNIYMYSRHVNSLSVNYCCHAQRHTPTHPHMHTPTRPHPHIHPVICTLMYYCIYRPRPVKRITHTSHTHTQTHKHTQTHTHTHTPHTHTQDTMRTGAHILSWACQCSVRAGFILMKGSKLLSGLYITWWNEMSLKALCC